MKRGGEKECFFKLTMEIFIECALPKINLKLRRMAL